LTITTTATKKPFHAQFESEVRELLVGLEFKDVGGGPSFNLGPVQIDACAGHEQTLLIIECTTAKGRLKPNLREKIKAFRGIREQIEANVSKNPTYSKYREFIYIVATNAEVNVADRNFAGLVPKVVLWDRQVVEYYQDLHSAIGRYAKYNLLGELEVKPFVESTFQVPAFRIHTGNTELYEFFADAGPLLEVSYVARREVGQEYFYQRMVKKSRLKRITSYVIDEGRIFPNSIVVAFVQDPKFAPLTQFLEQSRQREIWPEWIQFGVLTFPKTYRSCWIVDGQHRLYGLAKVPNTRIPVTAFGELAAEDQARYFLDINGEQRRVPADLIWDLSGELTPNTENGIISRIAKRLEASGPLSGQIYIPYLGSRKGKPIKFASVCDAMRRVALVRQPTVNMKGGAENHLRREDSEETVEITSKALSEFVGEIQKAFLPGKDKSPDYLKDFFFHNTGFGIQIFLFERLLVCLDKIPSAISVAPYVAALKDYVRTNYRSSDLKDLRKACVGESGRLLVADEFAEQINSRLVAPTKPLPLSQAAEEAEREYKEIERNLRFLIGQVLRKAEKKNWAKERVPSDLLQKLEARRTNKAEPLWTFLTLGECKHLILQGSNWPLFKDIFLGSGVGFDNKEMFSELFQHFIDKGRNPQVHGRVAGTKYGDIDVLKGVKKKLNGCIENGLKEFAPEEV